MVTLFRLSLLALAVLLVPLSSLALPRFAVMTGMKCQACHVNPAGGGMRQQFGAKFGREELPVPEWQGEGGDLTNLVRDVVGIGADFRTLYYVRQVPDSAGTSSQVEDSFFQMQGDLYLNFRLGSKANLYLKKGLYSGFEIFGQLNVLPMKGYLKIGKFIPAYGLRLDDHTAFIRTYTGFSPESGRPELTGAEAAIGPGDYALTLGIYNSTDGFGTTGSRKALLARGEGGWRLSEGITAMAGGNVLQREAEGGGTETLYGGFGGFGISDLILTGEVDYIQSPGTSGISTGVVVYGEASYTIIPGIDLKAGYDFYDEDIDTKTGAKSRYSFGVEFFPLSGVEVRPVYRILREEPTDTPDNEFLLLFHIYI